MITGSCHCGTVKYEVPGKLLRFVNCHCDDCRKFSGSVFAAVVVAKSDGFRVTAGADQVVEYPSSPGKCRCFCRVCGVHLFAFAETRPGLVLLRAGTLDTDPGLRPEVHIWTSAKAPWYEILDDLPRLPRGFPEKQAETRESRHAGS